jgi:uncharacterized phage protein (TIGR01671 family)
MREIKFRGISKKTGKFVYGYLIRSEEGFFIFSGDYILVEEPDYHPQGMGCGLEDRNITDRYDAMEYGWNEACDAYNEQIPEFIEIHPETAGQLTGPKDKNGKKIYEGDLLNIFYTSGNGQHIHDTVYEVAQMTFRGIELKFKKLLWVDNGYNQYPIDTTLRYGIEIDERGGKLLIIPTYGKNNILGHEWKTNDESYYFEIIGNIHENSDLLGDINDGD